VRLVDPLEKSGKRSSKLQPQGIGQQNSNSVHWNKFMSHSHTPPREITPSLSIFHPRTSPE